MTQCGPSPARATWPTARWPRPCTWRSRWSSRCSWRARPGWARRRWPVRWPWPPARSCSGSSATRASTCTMRCTTGTTRASCWPSGRRRAARTRAGCSRATTCWSARCCRRSSTTGPSVLLIDEVDRADDEFEAFLLELLSDFAVSIPELGTVAATRRPLVVLTSNRTRELHDALKRRCLYHWIDYPDPAREAEIVRARLPGVADEVAERVCLAVARLREQELYKLPGVGETISWARALLALEDTPLEETLGVVLKVREDIESGEGAGTSLKVSDGPLVPPRTALRRLPARAGSGSACGELLSAHRALRASIASDRVESYLALRAVLCSRQEDLAPFDAAFVEVFGRPRRVPRAARDPRRHRRRWCCRSVAVPPAAPRWRRRRTCTRRRWCPPRGRTTELLQHKDFAEFTAAERGGWRGRSWPGWPHRGRAASAGAPAARTARGPGRAAAAPTCAARPARRCARAASRSSATGASRASGPRPSFWCAMSRARWSPTRGCCSCTCRRAWPRAAGSRRSRSAPA